MAFQEFFVAVRACDKCRDSTHRLYPLGHQLLCRLCFLDAVDDVYDVEREERERRTRDQWLDNGA